MPAHFEAGDVAPHPVIRRATRDDLPRVVDLIRGGSLDGGARDDPGDKLRPSYYAAFDEIARDAKNDLYVAEVDGEVVGTFQLTLIRHVQDRGGLVAQLESVHVAEPMRGRGIGEAMIRWAIGEARRRGCFRVQLTSNNARADAHRFYERLGFARSHAGMKFTL